MRIFQRDVNPQNLETRVALISAAGAVTWNYGGLMSVVKTAAGSYTVKFNPPFSKPPSVFLQAYGGTQYVSVIASMNGGISCDVVWSNTPGGAGIDTAFNIWAVGPLRKA